MEKYHINKEVIVVLTRAGALTLNNITYTFKKKFPDIKVDIPRYKEGDLYRAQLWQLMNDFGDVLSMSLESPFKDNEIYFEYKESEKNEYKDIAEIFKNSGIWELRVKYNGCDYCLCDSSDGYRIYKLTKEQYVKMHSYLVEGKDLDE